MGTGDLAHNQSPIIAIGGVGGSGTRLIAKLLSDIGYYIGGDLNQALDNLWFSLLFRRAETLFLTEAQVDKLINIFLAKMSGNNKLSTGEELLVKVLATKAAPPYSTNWLQKRASSFLSSNAQANGMWGWKEPNTHIVLERLADCIPNLKYIHMIRNGLDMAYSDNQNQLRLWGRFFLGDKVELTPYYSLKYWRVINERVLNIGRSMGSDFIMVDFDKFCSAPHEKLIELTKFIGIDVGDSQINNIKNAINPPASIGRYKQYGLESLDEDDVSYVESLGFDVSI